MKKARYVWIDITKFILSIVILLYHYNLFKLSWSNKWLMQGGYLAVDCFFVISGFFYMATVYSLEKDQIKIIPTFIRKVKGLYVYYFVALIVVCAFMHLKLEDKINSVEKYRGLLGEILLIQEWGIPFFEPMYNGPTWYVSAMLLCVLLLTISFKIISKKIRIFFLLATVIGTCCVLMLFVGNLHVHGTSSFVPVGVVRGLAGMGSGCLVYILSQRVQQKRNLFGYMLFMILCIFICIVSKDSMFDFLMIPASCGLVLFGANGKTENGKLTYFSNILGKLSYVVYLNQGVVRYALDEWKGQYTCLMYVFACVLVAIVMVALVEFCGTHIKSIVSKGLHL